MIERLEGRTRCILERLSTGAVYMRIALQGTGKREQRIGNSASRPIDA
jgi:hypothetical protein